MRVPYRKKLIRSYMLNMLLRDLILPPKSLLDVNDRLELDVLIIHIVTTTRYLRMRQNIPKQSSLDLAWAYAEDPRTFDRFLNMMRVTPETFHVLLSLIEDDGVFSSNRNPQAPVKTQLGVTLFRLGRYGNGASVEDIARTCGCSEGAVEKYTNRCIGAISRLHDTFVRKLTPREVEREKVWVEKQVGCPDWRDGWVMYDGTIVVLFQKPGLNGDAYYTRKSNYGLNVQIGNVPSNLRIVDYAHGMTGSAHDSSAFKHTAAGKYPNWFFSGREFAWTDSGYAVDSRTIAVHKKPASLEPQNASFDKAVSHLRVRSEHCMGALKGRWQCLRGLRTLINSKRDHIDSCKWITVAIILHNMALDVEGGVWTDYFMAQHDFSEEDNGAILNAVEEDGYETVENNSDARRRELVLAYSAFREVLAEQDEE